MPKSLIARNRWYCVHTQPRREAFASYEIGAQGFKVFLPQIVRTVRHARKNQTVTSALFPRYLFVALDLDRDRWRSINGTFGVLGLVAVKGRRPDPVPDGVVETLIACQDSSGTQRFAFQEGQAVRVLAGPLAHCIGLIERLDDNGRVRVLLDLLGGQVPATVTAGFLEPAP